MGNRTALTTFAAPQTPWAARGRRRSDGTSTYLSPTSARARASQLRAFTPARSLPAPGSTRTCTGRVTMKASSW
eukprot:4515061-Pyramimonas_sp.AAC.1